MEINDDDSIKPSHVEDKDTIYIVCSNYNCLKNGYDLIGIAIQHSRETPQYLYNLNSSNKSYQISNIY